MRAYSYVALQPLDSGWGIRATPLSMSFVDDDIVRLALRLAHSLIRRRLWACSIEQVKELGAPFFLELIPKVSALANAEETIKAVFDDFSIVMTVLGAKDRQAEMAMRLMNQFLGASTNSTKGRIAEISNQLVSQAALKNFQPESLHKDEYEMLAVHFGARPLKRFEKLLVSE